MPRWRAGVPTTASGSTVAGRTRRAWATGGAGPSGAPAPPPSEGGRPGCGQQSIEAAGLADACARAYALTGDGRFVAGVSRAVAWFLGDNDARVAMFDPVTGGGYDGLEPGGHNDNQGAESTLALVST